MLQKTQTNHELRKVFGQLVAVKWEAVEIPEHKISLLWVAEGTGVV